MGNVPAMFDHEGPNALNRYRVNPGDWPGSAPGVLRFSRSGLAHPRGSHLVRRVQTQRLRPALRWRHSCLIERNPARQRGPGFVLAGLLASTSLPTPPCSYPVVFAPWLHLTASASSPSPFHAWTCCCTIAGEQDVQLSWVRRAREDQASRPTARRTSATNAAQACSTHVSQFAAGFDRFPGCLYAKMTDRPAATTAPLPSDLK